MRTLGMKANWPRERVWAKLGCMAIGALMVAAVLILAGKAHASPFYGSAGDHDQYAMWEDVIDFAPSVTPSDAGGFAQRVCNALSAGSSEGYLISTASAQFGVTPTVVRYLMHAGEFHYCPDYFYTTGV